jgi:DNA-binding response OmpR family regulator
MLLQWAQQSEVPAPLRELVAKHRAEQLQHRRGDKKHVLDAIANTLRRLDDDEKEIRRRGGAPTTRLEKQRAELIAHRKRIRALTNDELLAEYWGSEKRLTADVVDHEHED